MSMAPEPAGDPTAGGRPPAGSAGDADRGAAAELEAVGITKVFPGPTVACEDVSLTFRPGEIHALLGENGAGKTTLMRILSGVTKPTGGTIRQAGRPVRFRSPREALQSGVGMVYQHFLLIPRLTVAENVALGFEHTGLRLDRKGLNQRVADFADGIGLPVAAARRAEDLSVGERQRVEIVRALYQGARTLILDEPTAVLTPSEVESLFVVMRRLRDSGSSIVLISHKLKEVRAVADRITVMRRGRVVGSFGPSAGTEELGQAMVGHALAQPQPGETPPGSRDLLALRKVVLGGSPGLHDVDLTLHDGEILGVAGVDGNGQVELEAILSGGATIESGAIMVDGTAMRGYRRRDWQRHRVARIPSDRHRDAIVPDAKIWENAVLFDLRGRFSGRGLLHTGDAVRYAETIIDDFDVRCTGPDQKVSALSGGNQQKLVVGRVISGKPRIVVACQPTRGLDVGAATAVHGLLFDIRRAGGGVILISADLDEITVLADRVCVMYEGRIIGEADPSERGRIGQLMAGVAT